MLFLFLDQITTISLQSPLRGATCESMSSIDTFLDFGGSFIFRKGGDSVGKKDI